ncbi:MAG TPA: GNAT family N-acetyltransferase [Solirubrobacteraceae bacterium]|jgi:ribosomal protein S18 acetylase RimI-like enzyme|nr:GNAT family N-acetyltransferase [Solirubrobacteraceae bacterium]
MTSPAARRADLADAGVVAQLLHDFNTEFGDPAPDPPVLAERIRELLAGGDTAVLLTPDEPRGLALVRFRPSLWSLALECYLAELYVQPEHRGRGLGRALLEGAIDHARERGADYMDLSTAETDTAARALYESLGFSNREGKPDGPVNYHYERTL